jgi:arabinogalactan oligomer/maltooligosaccharide transport system permease protein
MTLGTRTAGLVAKILILALSTSVLGYMAFLAFLAREWIIGGVLVAIIVLANVIYISKKTEASKFFFPGTIFLIIFLIVPIVYTGVMSTFNYQTGNIISKEEALDQLEIVGLTLDETGTTFDMVVGRYQGSYAVLLTDQIDGTVQLGVNGELRTLSEGEYEVNEFAVASSFPGFESFDIENDPNAESILGELVFQLDGDSFISAQGFELAAQMVQTYKYDSSSNTLTDLISGFVWVDNGNGNFVNPDDPDDKLYPGWTAFNPSQNYVGLLTDPRLSGPFIGVFIWTLAFSLLTVASMFLVGFLLAVVLDKKMRGRNFYRAILILPYAMPSFMSILIWAGMFNREIGVINALLGIEVDWLNDPWLARGAILIVNLWLGFPYFYLISTGALQALPSDLEEAAAIDGASAAQIFWRIKFPLVLEILAPLLIASLAFNFNNFNLVYLLTRGGPTNVLDGESAGATDILITYAYKTAFSGAEQDFGLASAISVIVFVIVGALSLWSLKQSKVLENVK